MVFATMVAFPPLKNRSFLGLTSLWAWLLLIAVVAVSVDRGLLQESNESLSAITAPAAQATNPVPTPSRSQLNATVHPELSVSVDGNDGAARTEFSVSGNGALIAYGNRQLSSD